MTDLISVVIPSFNEERNVPKIYEAVRAALAGAAAYGLENSAPGSEQGTQEIRS